MSYIIASMEGEYDKYISLGQLLEVLCCLSEHTAFYITNYLEHHNFLDQVQSYYIDAGDGKISLIDNGHEIILELFREIRDIAPCSNIMRDLTIDLENDLNDIHFIADDLNKLELLQKFGSHTFTNEVVDDDPVRKMYENEKQTVIDKLYNFISKDNIVDEHLIPIRIIPEIIGQLFYNFKIYNDALTIVDFNYWAASNGRLIPREVGSKFQLTKKDSLADIDIELKLSEAEIIIDRQQKEIEVLQAQLTKRTSQPADDLKGVPHQSYRTVDRVMYAMAQLTKEDNSKPFSQNKPSLNASITTILQNDGVPLESEAVGKWLSRINDIKPVK